MKVESRKAVSSEQQATFQGLRRACSVCKACAAYPAQTSRFSSSAIINPCFDTSTPRSLPAGRNDKIRPWLGQIM